MITKLHSKSGSLSTSDAKINEIIDYLNGCEPKAEPFVEDFEHIK